MPCCSACSMHRSRHSSEMGAHHWAHHGLMRDRRAARIRCLAAIFDVLEVGPKGAEATSAPTRSSCCCCCLVFLFLFLVLLQAIHVNLLLLSTPNPNPPGRPDWQNQKFLKCCRDHGIEHNADCRYPQEHYDMLILGYVNFKFLIKCFSIVLFKPGWVSHAWHKCFTDGQYNGICCWDKQVEEGKRF